MKAPAQGVPCAGAFFVPPQNNSISQTGDLMTKSLSMLAAVAAFAVVGFGAQSAQAQGCCKAGLCRIPTLPSTAATSMAMLQPQIDAQIATRALRPVTTNGDTATLTQISLSNPSGSRSAVEYVLDGKSYVLEPGMALTFNTSQARKIEFKRGAAESVARYRVSRGSYEFAQTEKGWELYRLASR